MPATSKPTLLAHGLLQDPGAIPLVIGVVGHRDPIPEVIPLLEANLRLQLEQLIRELPHTPLLMLNGLAEGIDSIVAMVFADVMTADRMGRGEGAPHHQLIAALPKTPDQYRADFDDPKALAVLEDLLVRSDAILHPGNCADLRIPARGDGHTSLADDPACYGQQSQFLVRNSYLLFAFYDGVDTYLEGGTSQSIAMHKGVIHPLFVSVEEVLNKQETGVLVTHQTPRRRPDSPRHGAGAISFWPDCDASGVEIPPPLLLIPRHIEAMNAAIARPGFQPADYGEGLNTRLWSLANEEAVVNKKKYELLCRILVILGFVLVLLAQLMQVGQGLWWGLLLVAFLIFPRLQERPKQEFISLRCLAECLSVQHLWAAGRIEESAADLFLSRSHTELGWIRTVVRSVRLQLLSLYSREEQHQIEALERAGQWIDGQVSYLSRTIGILGDKALRWRRIAAVQAVAAVILAILQSLPQAPDGLGNWVVVLLAGFASAVAYRELMGYQDTMERYALSIDQFIRAQQAMEAIAPVLRSPSEEAINREQLVVEAIGREKLDELNHWVSDQLQRVYAPGT